MHGLHSLCSASYWMQLSSHTHISCMYSSIPLVSQPSHWTMSFYESGLMQHEAHRCQLSRIGQDCPRLPLSRKETAIVIPPWYNSFSLDFYLWFHITWELSQWCYWSIPTTIYIFYMYRKTWRKIWIVVFALKLCALYFFVLKFGWESKHEVANMAIAMQQHRLSYRQIQHCRAASKHLTLIGKAWVTWKVNLPSLLNSMIE